MQSPHASLNATPSIAVTISILLGATPIWKIVPFVNRSSTVRVKRGHPKRFKVYITFFALLSSDSIHIPISPVARGHPCAARAYAQTTIHLTPSSDNSCNISL